MNFIPFRYIPFFLFLLLLIGCSDKGVRLDGQVLDNGTASFTIGDGGTCASPPCTSGDWNDSFITPTANNSFTVAMRGAALIKVGDLDDSPSYTIFDTGDDANPSVVSFTPGTTPSFGANPDAPPDGTYDRIQYVLSYIEMTVLMNNIPRRVRLYLGSFTDPTVGSVIQKDILVENLNSSSPAPLSWIDPGKGLGDFFSTRPISPVLQVPEDQLGTEGVHDGSVDSLTDDPYIFTVNLNSPITVSSDEQTVIQLNFDTTKIFFFDETNRNTSNDDLDFARNNSNFDPKLSLCTRNPTFTNEPCDGRLDANPEAKFWFGLPAVSATASGGGGTTTPTTTSTTTTTL